MEQENAMSARESLADKVASGILTALAFLMPVLFLPSAYVPFQFTKMMLVYVGVIAALIVWILGRLQDGVVTVVRPRLILSYVTVVLAYLVAALLSPVKASSFFGSGFELGTFSSIVVFGILLFLVSTLFTHKVRAAYLYGAFLVSFIVVALYQGLRLIVGPSFLSFGLLTRATDNVVGSWSDLGVYFGAVALFAFVTLELLELPRLLKVLCGLVLAVALFFLSVVNFSAVWYVIGIFSLIFFIYTFSLKKSREAQGAVTTNRKLPVVSLVILIISFIFILSRGNLYATLGNDLGMSFFNRFAVSNIEVRPSWSSTFGVAKQSLANRHVFFGVGPNRFESAWVKTKPLAINSTDFWATDFMYGVGFIPTFVVTTGVVGFAAWALFMVAFILAGFRALFVRYEDTFGGYLAVSSFVVAFYLWIFSVLHVPSAPIMVITFIFTGVFFAVTYGGHVQKFARTFNIIKDPKASFVSVLMLITLLFGSLVFTYTVGKRFISAVNFNQALAAANINGSIEGTEKSLMRAITLFPDDTYYRTLSTVNLIKVQNLLASTPTSQDVLRNQFQTYFSTAQAAAQAAVKVDATSYENWLTLGKVYEAVVPLKIEGAYDQALTAYKEAKRLNPTNPAILLMMARLEASHENNAEAKKYIGEALKLKSNYTDAIYLLAQIQILENDLKSAIQSVEAAAIVNPGDSGVYLQLGLLRYGNKDYSGAASALEQAILIQPDFANAKYYLGLAYYKLGKTNDAIRLFEDILKTNPDNADIQTVIKNLKAGRDPLSSTQQSTGDKSSKNLPPPVQEKSSSSTSSSKTESGR